MKQGWLGIDPGINGAFALLDSDGRAEVWEIGGSLFDAAGVIISLKEDYEDYELTACIEKVHSMPGMNCAAVFDFGHTVGWLKGLLYGLDIPIATEPPPPTWKRGVGIALNPPKLPRNATAEERAAHKIKLSAYKRGMKTISRDRARQLFPQLAGKLSLVKDADKAEALLLAYYLKTGRGNG